MRAGSARTTRRRAITSLVASVFALAAPAAAQHAPDRLKQARDAFEYGDFAGTVELLEDLPDSGLLALEGDRVDAFRLLGLAHFFRGNEADAASAFFGLLKQNPDYQMDPFYVPPNAVAFFDQVRREHEPLLAPIRERRRRRLREQELEEEARRAADDRRRQMLSAPPPPQVIERQVALNSRLVATMPFGLGQFQNGQAALGSGLATLQVASGLGSVLAFLAVESLRDPATGAFRQGNYQTARTFDVVKWIGAATFYTLWAGGAIDAHLRFVPSRVVSEGPPVGLPDEKPKRDAGPRPGVSSPREPQAEAPTAPGKGPEDMPAATEPGESDEGDSSDPPET